MTPVTRPQLRRLWGEGRVSPPAGVALPPCGPLVVDAHYDAESGLRLDLRAAEDDV
jgi:hypothetical protein